MASVCKNKKGQWSIQYTLNRRRETIYVGKVNRRVAEDFCRLVEDAVDSEKYGQPLSAQAQMKMDELAPVLRNKLIHKNLAKSHLVSTVSQLTEYCCCHAEVADSTMAKYYEAHVSLVEYFGSEHLLRQITHGDAVEFYSWLQNRTSRRTLKKEKIADTTSAMRCKQVRQFFNTAVNKEWLARNPFDGIRLRSSENPERQQYVPVASIEKLLRIASPSIQLVLASCRFGGLRAMSEILPMKWSEVDFESGQIKIYSPKNHRYAHKAWRVIPIYPSWRTYLQSARDRCGKHEEYILNEGREISSTAWYSRLRRLCKQAELVPWPSLFHSLRGSRATDLINEGFSEHVVCDWQNSSPKMLRRHYLKTTEKDFSKALLQATDETSKNEPDMPSE